MQSKCESTKARKGALGVALGLALSFGFALPAVVAIGAQPAEAGQWKLTDTKSRKYFVPDDQLDKTTTRTKLRSDLVSTATKERGRATRPVKESGTTKSVETSEEVAGDKSLVKKPEGRYSNLYETWPVDTLRVITKTTPYTNWDVTEWEEAKEETYKVTYRVKDEVTWRDPTTGNRYTETVTYDEQQNETKLGPWGAKSSRKETGKGNDVAVDKTKVSTRTDSKLIKKIAALEEGGLKGANTVGVTAGFAADAGKGAATARSTAYKQTLALSGAEKAKAKGGGSINLDALLAAAKAEPDLLAGGTKAWKLGAQGQSLVFTPYDSKGSLDKACQVYLDAGKQAGKGAQGAEIAISNYSLQPLSLQGDFRLPRGGGKASTLKAAN